MNHAALLALIADLYAQLDAAQRAVAEKDAKIAELEKKPEKES